MIVKGDAQTIALAVLFAATSLIVSSLIPYAWAVSSNPGVFSVSSKPYGLTYGEWTAKFWQWVMAIPQSNNPITDQSGKNCAVNQNDPHVFFLAGTTGGPAQRACTIPSGKAILVPILNGECSYAEYPKSKTETELRSCAITGDNGGTVQATVDGKNLQNLDTYRVQSPLFNATFADHNIFGAPAGMTQAVSDGWWVFLQPLAPGMHEIHFSGVLVANPATASQSFANDVTYKLLVQ
ncbi:MAG TPA: hypothetical protein DD730_16475 [Desulfosporosinus sp.]|jgi:hypothetical protein|nr:hypothetical protein [Desulfosporosinus sp.]